MKGIKLTVLFINLLGLVFVLVTKNYQYSVYLILFLLYFLFVFHKGDNYEKLDFFGQRANLASNIVLLLFLIAVCRLINIQIFNKEYYEAKIEKQSEALVISMGSRGEIIDSTGKSLAYNVTTYTMAIDPSKIYDNETCMNALNDILDLKWIVNKKVNKKEVIESLNDSTSARKKYKMIAKDISEDEKIEIEGIMKKYKLRKNEIFFTGDFQRIYPRKDIYQNLVGFVGENSSSKDKKGLFGIENAYDSYLRGKALKKKIRVDRQRRKVIPTSNSEMQKKIDGKNVHLTIDNDINFVLNEEIKKKFDETKSEAAFGIVMDPNSGKILGTASFYKNKSLSIRNGVFQDQVEPGSIFKPIIMSAALNEKFFTKDTSFNIGDGTITKHNHTIKETTKSLQGVISAADIIRRSSNTGMVLVGDHFNNELFEKYLKNFGLYDITGVDFPNEKKPYTVPYKKWDRLKKSTMSFGQGIAITPVQMVTAFSAVVNGGTLYRPYIVEKIETEDGVVIRRNVPKPVKRVITKETSDIMKELLENAVNAGTGTRAKVEGYRIGGKTGTGQVPGARGGYLANDYLASFIGFFPVESPKYVILIMVLKPNGKSINEKYGGSVAAPVFGEIVRRITKIKSIFNNDDSDNVVTNISRPTIEKYLKKDNKIELTGVMPNLTGYSPKEVIYSFEGNHVEVEIEGAGLIVDQDPKPGSPMENIKKIKLILKENVTEIKKDPNNIKTDIHQREETTDVTAGTDSSKVTGNTPQKPITNSSNATTNSSKSGSTGSTTKPPAANTSNTATTNAKTNKNSTTTNTTTTTTTKPKTTETSNETQKTTVKPPTTTSTSNSGQIIVTETVIDNNKTNSTGSGSGGVNYGKKIGKYKEIIIDNQN
ncbi:penicillin-binding protein [Fusobacterium sp. PH5-44]|uniref:penicillin-binding protein n=1 Tax=unclassified Fusobacterium TaxID=2648384 RepID=UPI003D20220B